MSPHSWLTATAARLSLLRYAALADYAFMIKWLTILIVVGSLLIFAGSLEYQRSLRAASVDQGRANLMMAYTNYLATGKIEPNGNSKPFLFTNVESIGGIDYQSVIAMQLPFFRDDGVLAMTAGQQFVFFCKNGEPFVVRSSGRYRGHYFHFGL